MRKKLFTLLLAVAASVGTMFASDIQVDGIWYDFGSSTLTASVTYRGASFNSYENEYIGSVIIPESVTYSGSTYSVTSIGDYAFQKCGTLTSVTIPNSVTKIGGGAFWDCSSLTSINIPQSVTRIGCDAFGRCYELEKVNITDLAAWCNIQFGSHCGEDASSPLKYAGLYLNGEKITDIVIPNSVTQIGNGAFKNYKDATSVIIPESVTSIGEEAFSKCTGISNIDIPNSVVSIGSSAFYDVPNITYAGTDSYSAKSVNGYVEGFFVYGDQTKTELRACSSAATGIISIPDGVTSIKRGAFSGCDNIVSVNVPQSVTEIDVNAFYQILNVVYNGSALSESYNWYAKNINKYADGIFVYENESKTQLLGCPSGTKGKISLPQGIQYIKDDAFRECRKISSVKIPESVITIGDDSNGLDFVFYGCHTLKSLIFCSQTAPNTRQTRYLAPKNVTIFVPDGCVNQYIQSIKWNWEGLVIREYTSNEKSESSTSVSIKIKNNLWELDSLFITSIGIEGGETFAGNTLEFTGLEPNTEYNDYHVVLTSNTGETEIVNVSFTTTALELTTQPSKAVSSTTAILLAQTNMADIETSCGFEYKRNDAPADMSGTKVYCPVASGQMAGRLKGLKDDVYYKYRAFYQSAAGNMYYGDWQYIFTGDVSVEFDPILYTYEATIVRENEATINGYALAGSEDFTEQGFEYWAESRANGGANAPRRMAAAIGEHKFAQASGIKMTVTLTDLDEGTVYKYRAYGKAGEQYFYGTEQTFTTNGTYTPLTYMITFVNWDGTELQASPVEENMLPVYTGHTPVRPEDAGYTYTFDGWTPSIVIATADATYTATYTETPKGQGIDGAQSNHVQCTKVIHNGQILILRGDKTYTLTGQEIK